MRKRATNFANSIMNSNNLKQNQPKSNYWSPLTDLVEETEHILQNVESNETNKNNQLSNEDEGATTSSESSEVQRAIDQGHTEVSKTLREITEAVDELEKRLSNLMKTTTTTSHERSGSKAKC